MINQLIFGSTAARHWFSDFREPKDLDVLTQEPLMTKTHQHYWFGASSQWILNNNKDKNYVDPEFLLTTKAAHGKWDIHWNKTVDNSCLII